MRFGGSTHRLVTVLGLAAVAGLAWAYLWHLSVSSGSDPLAAVIMGAAGAWSGVHLLGLFLMWAVMMAAMMLPSASRMVLAYVTLAGRRHPDRGPAALGVAFVAGYLTLWTAFSGGAALLQWGLYGEAVLTPEGRAAARWAGTLVLVTAGIYQWTPLKHACLRRCRSPLGFLLHSWRDGLGGAFRMGTRHGVYCIGCCGGLMLLLFAAGVMNLLWVAAIAAVVLVEKLFPAGDTVARSTGAVLAAGGVALLFL